MRVDEARQDQVRAVVDLLQPVAGQFGMIADGDDAPVIDQDGPVFPEAMIVGRVLGIGMKVEDAAPDQLLHGYFFKEEEVRRAISSAAVKAAMISGRLSREKPAPMGQVRPAASIPREAAKRSNWARLVALPIIPM